MVNNLSNGKTKDRKLVLNIGFSPGDIVVFTGSVRDLKLAYPEIQVSVTTCCPAIFEHSPHLAKVPKKYKAPQMQPNADNLNRLGFDIAKPFEALFTEILQDRKLAMVQEGDKKVFYHVDYQGKQEGVLFTNPVLLDGSVEVEYIDVHYPDIHNCGFSGRHFSTAYHMYLEANLGLPIPQTSLLPDLHLSDEERGWMNQVEQTTGYSGKFWLINSGYKADYPLKNWGFDRHQKVVDLLRNDIQFVQVGELSKSHTHRPLSGVIDLRGKTNLREFIRLSYHAAGAVCGVTLLHHLMAAWQKPCVTIAGGREPRRWESYPHSRYMDTNGLMPCCGYNGCWLSGRRDDHGVNKVCTNMVGAGCYQEFDAGEMEPIETSARCMAMISPERVAEEIMNHYRGGVL